MNGARSDQTNPNAAMEQLSQLVKSHIRTTCLGLLVQSHVVPQGLSAVGMWNLIADSMGVVLREAATSPDIQASIIGRRALTDIVTKAINVNPLGITPSNDDTPPPQVS